MSNDSINEIQLLAKDLRNNHNIKYTKALDIISKQKGYDNFHTAKKITASNYIEIYYAINPKHASPYDLDITEPASQSFLLELYNDWKIKTRGDLTKEMFFSSVMLMKNNVFRLKSNLITNYKEALDQILQSHNDRPEFLIHNFNCYDFYTNPNGHTQVYKLDLVTHVISDEWVEFLIKQNKPIISDYVWCDNCQQAYLRGKHKIDLTVGHNRKLCPYDQCYAETAYAIDWQEMRNILPDYPLKPEEGKFYPLYPEL